MLSLPVLESRSSNCSWHLVSCQACRDEADASDGIPLSGSGERELHELPSGSCRVRRPPKKISKTYRFNTSSTQTTVVR